MNDEPDALDLIVAFILGFVFYWIWCLYVWEPNGFLDLLVVIVFSITTNFIHRFIMAFIDSDDDFMPTGTV